MNCIIVDDEITARIIIQKLAKDIEDLNARLSWANDDDTLEFGLWGKNLLDNRYMFSLGGYAADVLNVPHGRINRGLEAGIDVKYSF